MSQTAIQNRVPPALAEWRPAANPWLICVAVMLGTFMEVLDTSVANVALPHIAGNLSATTDEATWVLTSYLVSNAIVLPITGWASRAFGRKRLLMTCIGVFTVASFLCGAASSLNMLILARIVQGIGGGALQPIAQAILLESFPPKKRGAAMAAYTLGIVFAPVIGPTVGGWITDNYTWRWVFYINIPVGILAVSMVYATVFDPPHIKNARVGRMDTIGFGLLAIWIGTFQILLDKGQQDDWFGAVWIRWAALVVAAGFAAFVVRELLAKDPIVNLRVLKNRNFAAGTIMVTVVGVVLYGSTALLPLLLQDLMGYPALQSGLALSPRGFGSIASILILGRMVNLIDTRVLIAGALGLLAYSMWMLGRVDLEMTSMSVTGPIILNGAAVSALFLPLTITTVATLKTDEIGNATGIYNLMRNLGGSMGISLMTTMLARQEQIKQVTLVGHVTPYDPGARHWIAGATHALALHADPHTAAQQAYAMAYATIQQQAALGAYIWNFRLMAVLCVACIPLVFVFARVRHHGGADAAAAAH